MFQNCTPPSLFNGRSPSLSWELMRSARHVGHLSLCAGHHGSAHWHLVHFCFVFVCVDVRVWGQLNCLSQERPLQTNVRSLSDAHLVKKKKVKECRWFFLVFFCAMIKTELQQCNTMAAVSGNTSSMLYQLNHPHWPNDQQGRHLASCVCCLCAH